MIRFAIEFHTIILWLAFNVWFFVEFGDAFVETCMVMAVVRPFLPRD